MNLKWISTLVLTPALLLSCSDARDKAGGSVKDKVFTQTARATERIAEANQNEARAALLLDGEKLFEHEVFSGLVNVTERMIVLSLDGEQDEAKIHITFSGLKDMLQTKPVKGISKPGVADPKELNGTLFKMILAKESEYSYTFYEGSATILKFTEEEIILTISGKVGTFMETGNTDNWKPVEGTITLKSPGINRIKVSKEQLYYQ